MEEHLTVVSKQTDHCLYGRLLVRVFGESVVQAFLLLSMYILYTLCIPFILLVIVLFYESVYKDHCSVHMFMRHCMFVHKFTVDTVFPRAGTTARVIAVFVQHEPRHTFIAKDIILH